MESWGSQMMPMRSKNGVQNIHYKVVITMNIVMLVQIQYIPIVEIFKWGLAAFVLVLVAVLVRKLWNRFSNRTRSDEDEL